MGEGVAEGLTLRVRDGDLADAGSWVYVWMVADGKPEVVYVGATGLPPSVRAWLHLHDDDPNIGRVAARWPEARSRPLDVLAFRLDDGLSRAEVKAALIEALDAADLLSAEHVCDLPETGAASADARAAAEEVRARVAAERVR